MTWTNINDTNPSGNYTFGFERLTCICKEGNITVATTTQTAKGPIKRATYTFVAEITKGDIVALSADTGNTLTATDGLPVVSAGVAGMNFGIVMSDPKWDRAPAASATTWATMLTRHQYRIAEVWVVCNGILEVATVDAASGNVLPGSSMIFDTTDDGWVYGRVGLDDADSAVWDSSGADTGANGFIAEPISLHYSASDTGAVALAFGFVPIPMKT